MHFVKLLFRKSRDLGWNIAKIPASNVGSRNWVLGRMSGSCFNLRDQKGIGGDISMYQITDKHLLCYSHVW